MQCYSGPALQYSLPELPGVQSANGETGIARTAIHETRPTRVGRVFPRFCEFAAPRLRLPLRPFSVFLLWLLLLVLFSIPEFFSVPPCLRVGFVFWW